MTPQPTRQSHGSLALITIPTESQRLWLGQWNDAWQAISFVGGHWDPNETPRECMNREISEELDLTPGDDFRVSSHPIAIVEYTALSNRAAEWTQYHLELFSVQLTSNVAQRLKENPDNHWLSEQEIQIEITKNDVRISPTMKRVFDEANLWSNQHVDE